MKKSSVLAGALALLSLPALAVGNYDLKVALVVFNPIMTNVTEVVAPCTVSDLCDWPRGEAMAADQAAWWHEASHGMVKPEFVVITNVTEFPILDNGKRFTPQSFYDWWIKGEKDKHPGGHMDYGRVVKDICPWLLPMVERGEIDQAWFYAFPGLDWGESRMVGKGAYGCNYEGFAAPGNERLFLMITPNMERPDTPMENFGHSCEWILGSWYWNFVYSFENAISYTNTSDLALYRAHGSESKSNVSIGDVHYSPNARHDYDWGHKEKVMSYADCWYDFPDMKWVPREMDCEEWGGGVNHRHKIWFFHHMPQKIGLHRGHMMNWLTKYFNLNNGAYPIGSHETIHQEDVDLAGFFDFEMRVPEGVTQLVVRVETGREVKFALRKNLMAHFDRFQQDGPDMADYLTKDRQKSFTYVLNEKNNFGKGLAGTWYLTFGDAYGVGPVKRPLDGNTDYTVTMELSPKPRAWDGSAKVDITAPVKGQAVKAHRTEVKWTQTEPADGFYAYKLAYSLEGKEGPFTEICEDYHYAFKGPYKWTTVPLGVNTDKAVIRLVAMDLHGHSVTNCSQEFTIDTRQAQDPLKQPLRSLPRSRRR